MPDPRAALATLRHALVVGGGNMSHALLRGMTSGGGFDPGRITVVEPVADARRRMDALGVHTVGSVKELDDRSRNPSALVLAVKPQMFRPVAQGLLAHGVDTSEPLVLSVMAGVPTPDLARTLGAPRHQVVRAMPNTPAAIGQGMTALYAAPNMAPHHRQWAAAMMGAVGQTAWVDQEAHIDAATALSGSGPGYVLEMAHTMVQAGVQLGLTPEQARQMVAQTLLGTGALMQDAPQTPLLTMADQVTSPGGTTAAARTALHTHGVHDGLSNGIHAAYARSMELGGGGAAATGPRPATPLAQAGPAPAL